MSVHGGARIDSTTGTQQGTEYGTEHGLEYGTGQGRGRGSVITAVRLQPGDVIVLPAKMHLSKEQWELEVIAGGFVPATTVTRRSRLIVSAHPGSFSWRTLAARLFHIPVTDEEGLTAMVGAPVIAA